MSEVQFQEVMLQHYQALLNNLTVYTNEDGLCYTKKADNQLPLVLHNRRMTLPTENFNRKPDLDSFIVFHPFCESVVRGESEIIVWLKERMLRRLNAIMGIMIADFAELASDGELQKKLTTDQLSAIQTFGDADETTSANIAKVVEKVVRDDKENWVHFYLRHSGKSGEKAEKQSKRFCKVTFPIYRQLLEEGNKVAGITLRVKDKKFLKAVLEYVLEKIGTEDAYSFGSNSDIAPYYHALINAFAKVGLPISSRVYLFRKHMSTIANSRIHTDGWLDTFEAAAKSASFLPALAFNIGKGGQGTGNDNAVANAATAKIVEEVPVLQQSNGALQAMVGSGGGSSSLLHGLLTGNAALVSQANFNTMLGVQPPAMNPLQQGGSVLQNLLGVNNTVPAATSSSLGKSSLGAFGAAAAPQATPSLNSLLNGQYNRGWG